LRSEDREFGRCSLCPRDSLPAFAGDDGEEETAEFFEDIEAAADDFAEHRSPGLVPGDALSHDAARIPLGGSRVHMVLPVMQ